MQLVSRGFTWFYWLLLGFHCVRLCLNQVRLDSVGFSSKFTGFYRVFLIFLLIYQTLLGFPGIYWVLLGFIVFVYISTRFG